MPTGMQYIKDFTSGKPRPLELETTAGVLSVDASGTTVPVSGTFYQATQPVSVAATVNVAGAFYQATQPVSIAGTISTSSSVTKSNSTLSSASSVTSGDFSSALDASSGSRVLIAGTHSAGGQVEIHVSEDDSTYYKLADETMYTDPDGAFGKILDFAPKYLKLKYGSGGTVTALGWVSS